MSSVALCYYRMDVATVQEKLRILSHKGEIEALDVAEVTFICWNVAKE
ncbi:17931_t:CDS:2, partial [Racocetra fulgida]